MRDANRIKKTTLEIVMEYRCGHPPASILAVPFFLNGDRAFQVQKAVDSLPRRPDGKIECRCPKCNRGAGWIVVKLSGTTIGRDEVHELVMDGKLKGADLSIGPTADSN